MAWINTGVTEFFRQWGKQAFVTRHLDITAPRCVQQGLLLLASWSFQINSHSCATFKLLRFYAGRVDAMVSQRFVVERDIEKLCISVVGNKVI